MFDTDPAPVGKNVPAQIEEMSQAMIRYVFHINLSTQRLKLTLVISLIICSQWCHG